MFGFWGWIIISIILLVASAALMETYCEYWENDSKCAILILLLFIMFIGVPASYLVRDYNIENQIEVVQETHDIKSLMNTTETTSSSSAIFIMGFGSGSSKEDNKSYYYTIVNYEGKGLKIEKYDCDTTYLVEEDIEQPYVEIIYKEYDICFENNFFAGGLFKAEEFEHRSVFDRYVLHVPENTIQIQWDVSLENLK